jgi:hypothetical protein
MYTPQYKRNAELAQWEFYTNHHSEPMTAKLPTLFIYFPIGASYGSETRIKAPL